MESVSLVIYVSLRTRSGAMPVEEWRKERTAELSGDSAVFHEPILGNIHAAHDGPVMISDDRSRAFIDYNVIASETQFPFIREKLSGGGFTRSV